MSYYPRLRQEKIKVNAKNVDKHDDQETRPGDSFAGEDLYNLGFSTDQQELRQPKNSNTNKTKGESWLIYKVKTAQKSSNKNQNLKKKEGRNDCKK